MNANLFAAAVVRAFETVPVPLAMNVVNPTENTNVIPMQETLEVRLEESTIQVPNNWPIKMEQDCDDDNDDDGVFGEGEDRNNCGGSSNSYGRTASQVSGIKHERYQVICSYVLLTSVWSNT